MQCVAQCRVPSSLRPVFGDPADRDALYSQEQVQAALLGYARREELLVLGKPGTLRLDKCASLLCMPIPQSPVLSPATCCVPGLGISAASVGDISVSFVY